MSMATPHLEEFEDDYKFLESYHEKNIIVTGASGDIGGTLWKLLVFYPNIKINNLILIKGSNQMTSEEEIQRNNLTKPQHLQINLIKIVSCDMENPEEIADTTIKVIKALSGKIDHIFFCHGIINFAGGLDSSDLEWDIVHNINVRSTMQMLSIALPFLRVNSGGSVTVLSSSAGEKPWPGHTIYNSAMATLNMMVRCAALENAHLKVRINAVAPGYVLNQCRLKSQRYLPTRFENTNQTQFGGTPRDKQNPASLSPEFNVQHLKQEELNTPLMQVEFLKNG
jgi:NAD(P)-dependent dehydrogenase (short-subunit alcohol dehydrogenase family)